MFSIIEVFRVFDGGRWILEEAKHFQPAQEQTDFLQNNGHGSDVCFEYFF